MGDRDFRRVKKLFFMQIRIYLRKSFAKTRWSDYSFIYQVACQYCDITCRILNLWSRRQKVSYTYEDWNGDPYKFISYKPVEVKLRLTRKDSKTIKCEMESAMWSSVNELFRIWTCDFPNTVTRNSTDSPDE